jgi:hypothetical protein
MFGIPESEQYDRDCRLLSLTMGSTCPILFFLYFSFYPTSRSVPQDGRAARRCIRRHGWSMERVAGEGPRRPGMLSRFNGGGAGEASAIPVHTGGDSHQRRGEAWSAKQHHQQQQRMPRIYAPPDFMLIRVGEASPADLPGLAATSSTCNCLMLRLHHSINSPGRVRRCARCLLRTEPRVRAAAFVWPSRCRPELHAPRRHSAARPSPRAAFFPLFSSIR